MGFEVVYCYKCQTRLTELQFQEGSALRIGTYTTCLKCAEELLAQLTPEQQKAVLAQSKVTVSTKKTEPPRVEKPATPHGGTAVTHARPEEPRAAPMPKALIYSLAAGGLLALILLFAAMRGGSGPRSIGGSASGKDKLPDGGAPTTSGATAGTSGRPSGPITVFDSKREEAAKAALQKARDFAKSHPDDFQGQIRQYEQAELDAEKTACVEEVRREKEAVQKRFAASLGPALKTLEEEIRAPLEKREYQNALNALDAARPRHAVPGWAEAVDRKIQETREKAAAQFAQLKAQAQEAYRSRAEDDIRRCREEATRWGIPKYIEEVEQILRGAVPAGGAAPAAGGVAPPAGEHGPFELDDTGAVRNWLIAGPFPNPNRTGLRFDFLRGEDRYEPERGREVVGPDGTRVQWFAHASPGSKVALDAIPPLAGSRGLDFTLAYCACWLECGAEGDVEVRVGSNDGNRLWVDQRRIGEIAKPRKFQLDEDRYPVKLTPGRHRVLIKVDNEREEFEFMLRVVTPQGERAPGIKVWN